ncbi:MAG: SpvB/TcaC N-terminal domain-containing protein, partial [Chitinophagaceae bacterium]
MKRHYLIALLAISICSFAANSIIRARMQEKEEILVWQQPAPVPLQKDLPGETKLMHEGEDKNGAPQSPASETYIPNDISDIRKAHPADQINTIAAPVANNMGNAALSFPVKIPAGRKGMQPEISIDYNSEGSNGWLGLGWNLVTPAISIETKWGVPRYNASLETETYLLNHQQLGPVAHRADAVARTGEKQFYPRVENEFEKIIRHNNSPTAYWWEVIDKSGRRNFYGGNPATGADPSATLTDANGNIAYWALTETRDPNGNFVKYRYSKVSDAGITGGSAGIDLYLASVTYTGNGTTEGKYTVEFTRDRQLSESKRQDVIINARWGFKQVCADLLRKIAVKFNGQNIRTYQLNYAQGAFYKTLLQSISEFDAGGTLFNTHSFGYYNDVQPGSTYQPLAGSEDWTSEPDNIKGTFLNPIDLFNDKASLLSGNKSIGGGFGIAITIGPYDGNLALKTNTAGVNFGFNYSRNEGMLALVDINGDGLADKVYKKNGQLSFRPNQSGPAGTPTFGDSQPITGIEDFNKGETFIGEVGLESHFGIFAGFEYARTEDITSIYFSDVNGDQLMDIVKEGRVYFNHLNNSGHPVFTLSSGDTPSPIDAASGIDGSIVENDPVAFEKSIDDNPLHDVVKVWVAPFNGTVSITQTVALIQDNSPDAQSYTAADGVRVAIQHKGAELWSANIAANDFTLKTPSGVGSIAVQKGDRIYFRVQSKFNGAYDQVSWSPQVTYSNHIAGLNDANALPHFQFKSDNDFLISGALSTGMIIDGQVKITGDFVKPLTSDDVVVKIVKKSGAVSTTLLQQTLLWNQATTLPISIDQSVLKNDVLFFSVSSGTNVDWAALQWNPFVHFTSTPDTAIKQLFDNNNNPLLYAHPTVDFQSYNKTIKPGLSWTVPATDTFSVFANPDMNFTTESGQIIFSVKKENVLIAKQVIPVTGGVVGAHPALSLIFNSGDKLFFEYHVQNEKLADAIDTSYVITDADPGDPERLIAGLHTTDNSFIFGPLYRHWGQFSYNGNRSRASQPIIETDLKLDESLMDDTPPTIDLSTASTADEMQDMYDAAGGNKPKEDKFIYLVPDNEHKYWIGYDNLTYVKKNVISSSRMGKDNLTPVNPIAVSSAGAGSGAVGITKVSNTDNFSLAAGIGPLGGSLSFGYTKFLYDFNDINGDRYPDILSSSKIQFTRAYGGLEPSAKNFSFGDVVKTDHFSAGFTLGGTFLKSGASNEKSTPKGAKAAKAGNQAGISAGISGNFNYNRDSTAYAWMDINGDDLPDRVYRNGTVELNLGYSFLPAEQWGYNGVSDGYAYSYGAGFSINIGAYSISAGIGLSRSESETERTLQD